MGASLHHKGRRILYRDYRHLQGAQFVEKIHEYSVESLAERGTDLLILYDCEGCFGDRAVVTAFKQTGAALRGKVHKVAVVGLDGVQQFLADVVIRFVRLNVRIFDDKQAALDWLVEN